MRLLFSPLTMCYCEYYESLVGMYLVLSLVPSPHVAEQAVHDPHGPTSQSTKSKRVGIFFDLLYSTYQGGYKPHCRSVFLQAQ